MLNAMKMVFIVAAKNIIIMRKGLVLALVKIVINSACARMAEFVIVKQDASVHQDSPVFTVKINANLAHTEMVVCLFVTAVKGSDVIILMGFVSVLMVTLDLIAIKNVQQDFMATRVETNALAMMIPIVITLMGNAIELQK
jgi:hypothetical protein